MFLDGGTVFLVDYFHGGVLGFVSFVSLVSLASVCTVFFFFMGFLCRGGAPGDETLETIETRFGLVSLGGFGVLKGKRGVTDTCLGWRVRLVRQRQGFRQGTGSALSA